MARDSKGARNSRDLGWVITLTAVIMEVSTLTKANGIGKSFPNVNVFRILILETIISDRGPAQAPNSMAFKILVWEVRARP